MRSLSAPELTPAVASGEPTFHRQVFVGGLHRSGTSVLTRALASHPSTTTLADTGVMEDEGHYLHDVVPSAFTQGGPGRFAFDRRNHLTEDNLTPGTGPELRARIDQAWRPFWADPAAPLRVEKSPQNLLQSRYLQCLYPEASFVFIMRHPATVALATRKWTRPGIRGVRRLLPRARPISLVRHWVWAHHLLAEDLPRLERAIVIRYEDLVEHPEQTLTRLAEFLGVENRFTHSAIRSPGGHYQAEWKARMKGGRMVGTSDSEFQWATASVGRWGYRWDDQLV